MKDTHDKEWIEHKDDSDRFIRITNGKIGYLLTGYQIPKSYIDQLRREQQEADKLWWASMVDKVKIEAKKELLDEINKIQNQWKECNLTPKQQLGMINADLDYLRAKTLGEQVKKE